MSKPALRRIEEWHALANRARALYPGLLICLLIALASTFIADHYGGPTLLYALLFGMALHFLSETPSCQAGIDFSARVVLRTGVALLGVRITLEQITALGWGPLLLVVASVSILIMGGGWLAKRMGLGRDLGLLTGGAVAICGASAALALASVMPRQRDSERHLILTVVGVTTLSTIAMIVYPLLVSALNLPDHAAGIFLGSTIHDVAQVVGAGYMVSEQTGDTSTIVKLVRVAMLVPVVVILGAYTAPHRRDNAAARRLPIPHLPLFLWGFVALVLINSAGWIPPTLTEALTDTSRGFLVAAIAALGLKTALQKLVTIGWRPVALMVIETLVLLLLVLAVIYLAGWDVIRL